MKEPHGKVKHHNYRCSEPEKRLARQEENSEAKLQWVWFGQQGWSYSYFIVVHEAHHLDPEKKRDFRVSQFQSGAIWRVF